MEQCLMECTRLFQNTPGDRSFLERIDLAGPAPVLESHLPLIQAAGIADSSRNREALGNCLFFARALDPVLLTETAESGQSFSPPVHVDLFQFNYYYLSRENHDADSVPVRHLRQWSSVRYADYSRLRNVRINQRQRVAAALLEKGVLYAWDPTAKEARSAFYPLSPRGIPFAPDPAHRILMSDEKDLLEPLPEQSRGLRLSVSPKIEKAPDSAPARGLPGAFVPSGFEVTATGPDRTPQILIRLVLAAQAGLKKISHEEVAFVTTRDLW
jgi:hypothetical protein